MNAYSHPRMEFHGQIDKSKRTPYIRTGREQWSKRERSSRARVRRHRPQHQLMYHSNKPLQGGQHETVGRRTVKGSQVPDSTTICQPSTSVSIPIYVTRRSGSWQADTSRSWSRKASKEHAEHSHIHHLGPPGFRVSVMCWGAAQRDARCTDICILTTEKVQYNVHALALPAHSMESCVRDNLQSQRQGIRHEKAATIDISTLLVHHSLQCILLAVRAIPVVIG